MLQLSIVGPIYTVELYMKNMAKINLISTIIFTGHINLMLAYKGNISPLRNEDKQHRLKVTKRYYQGFNVC